MTWHNSWHDFSKIIKRKMQILRYLQIDWDRIGCILHKQALRMHLQWFWRWLKVISGRKSKFAKIDKITHSRSQLIYDVWVRKLADTLLLASLTQKHRGAKHSPFLNSGTPYLKNFLHQKHKCEKMLFYTFTKNANVLLYVCKLDERIWCMKK